MPKIKEINIFVTSRKFPDGSIAEMVYMPNKDETSFLHYKKGKYKLEPNYPLGQETDANGNLKIITLKPLPPFNDMIKTGFLKLPSGVTEYKDELDLFKRIKKHIDTYVILPDDFSTVAAVYVMMSWIYDSFQVLPYLRVIGMYGTGKSRFLSAIGSVCFKSMMSGGSSTSASMYRTIDQVRGTFVLDEADYRASEMWSDIVKILNSGQTQGSPVIRMEPKGDGFITRAFHVFVPKVIASRESFSDKALESRCLTQIMLPQEKVSVPVHLPENFEAEAARLRNQLLLFRFKFYGKVKITEDSLPKIKDNRLRQSSLALTSTASILGQEIVKQIGDFLQTYEKNLDYDDISDPKADVVKCIIEMIAEKEFCMIRVLKIKEIADKFNSRFYDDYSDRETRHYTDKDDNVLSSPAYVVSPRKIGVHIRRLNLRVRRGREGYYIPVVEEYQKIKVLAKRYGFDKLMALPEKLMSLEKQEEAIDRANLNAVPDGFFEGDAYDEEPQWQEVESDKKDGPEKVVMAKTENESIKE